MTAHTKGPWEAAARQGDDWDSVVYVPGTPYEICQCFHDDDKDACEANARLISAAPDLLVALKELYAVVKGECASLLDEDRGGSATLDDEISVAIAKAEGK